MRHATYDLLRHSKKLLAFLGNQAARLSGTGAGTVVTFTNATNLVNLIGHGFVAGGGPFVLENAGGALPTGLDAATLYFVGVPSVDTLTLHITSDAAIGASNEVAFSTDGTGTTQILKGADELTVFDAMNDGAYSAAGIMLVTDIDTL
jgi:hypothetical protein